MDAYMYVCVCNMYEVFATKSMFFALNFLEADIIRTGYQYFWTPKLTNMYTPELRFGDYIQVSLNLFGGFVKKPSLSASPGGPASCTGPHRAQYRPSSAKSAVSSVVSPCSQNLRRRSNETCKIDRFLIPYASFLNHFRTAKRNLCHV